MLSELTSVSLETAPAYWFLNALHILLAHNESGEGPYSLLHLTAPAPFETPYHVHQAEDESFYVLEGEPTVIRCGEKIVAGPGSYVFLPRGVPHGFRSSSEKTSRVLSHAVP